MTIIIMQTLEKKFAHYATNCFSFLLLTPQELSEETTGKVD